MKPAVGDIYYYITMDSSDDTQFIIGTCTRDNVDDDHKRYKSNCFLNYEDANMMKCKINAMLKRSNMDY